MSRILNKETASNFESAEQSKQLIRTLSQSKCAKNILFKQKFIPIDVSFLFLITIPFFPETLLFEVLMWFLEDFECMLLITIVKIYPYSIVQNVYSCTNSMKCP